MCAAKSFFEGRVYWARRVLDDTGVAHIQFVADDGEKYALFRQQKDYSLFPVGGWHHGAGPGTLSVDWKAVADGKDFEVYTHPNVLRPGCSQQDSSPFNEQLRSYRRQIEALTRNRGYPVYKDGFGVQWYVSSDSLEIPYLVRLHRDNKGGGDGFGAATLYDAVAYIQNGQWDFKSLIDNKPVNYMRLEYPVADDAGVDLEQDGAWIHVQPDTNGCLMALHNPPETINAAPLIRANAFVQTNYKITLNVSHLTVTGLTFDVSDWLARARQLATEQFGRIYEWAIDADDVVFIYKDGDKMVTSTLGLVSMHGLSANYFYCSPKDNIQCTTVSNVPWK